MILFIMHRSHAFSNKLYEIQSLSNMIIRPFRAYIDRAPFLFQDKHNMLLIFFLMEVILLFLELWVECVLPFKNIFLKLEFNINQYLSYF